MKRVFAAHVRNGRLVLDEPTDLPEGTCFELVSVEYCLSSGGDLLDAEDRAELAQDVEASFVEEEAGQLIDAADALAELRAMRLDQDDLRELPRAKEGSMTTYPITSDTVTDEHVRWYQESIPDSPTTRDVITAATSDLPVLRWLGRRRIAAAINVRAKTVK